MKIPAFLTVSLLVSATVLASAQGRFSVSVTAAPTYAHSDSRVNFIIPDDNGQLTTETVAFNTAAFGYKVGAMTQYAFTPAWSVSAGLWYSRLGMNSLFPFSPGDKKARVIQQALQVPLLLNYRSGQQRLSPYFSLGALTSFSGRTRYRTEGSVLDVSFGKTVVFQPVLGAGVSYKRSQHLSFIAQPLLIWRFKPKGDYERFVAYQLQAQCQLLYSL